MNRQATLTFITSLFFIVLAMAQEPTTNKETVTENSTTASPAVVNCDCYYSTDCRTRHALCQLGNGCLPQGKNDGRCDLALAPENSSGLTSQPTTEQVALERQSIGSALDAYFRSFIKATQNGGGRPDATLLHSALNVPLAEVAHERVEKAVWVSLDALIGWDFQYPTMTERAQGFFGNIREVDGVHSAAAIIDAARRGLLDALKTGDDKKVSGPLNEFWSKNPGYIPNHLGRCYPHGHEEIRDMKAAVACQVDVLQRAALMLLSPASSTRADAKIEKHTRIDLSQNYLK